jgi:hypothetical protein
VDLENEQEYALHLVLRGRGVIADPPTSRAVADRSAAKASSASDKAWPAQCSTESVVFAAGIQVAGGKLE